VKVAELVAIPPAVLMAILPVLGPMGTVEATCEPEFTVKMVAFIPPKVTCTAPVSFAAHDRDLVSNFGAVGEPRLFNACDCVAPSVNEGKGKVIVESSFRSA